jgi:hypothetical protein
VAYFFEEMGSYTRKTDNLKFFLFVVIVAWILVMAFWLNFVSGLHEKMSAINWPLTVSTSHCRRHFENKFLAGNDHVIDIFTSEVIDHVIISRQKFVFKMAPEKYLTVYFSIIKLDSFVFN